MNDHAPIDNAFVLATQGYGYEDISLKAGMTKATARKLVWDVREKMQVKRPPVARVI